MSSSYWVMRSPNLGNDKPLKPEILHTLKTTQNKSFQAKLLTLKTFPWLDINFVKKNVIGVSENG